MNKQMQLDNIKRFLVISNHCFYFLAIEQTTVIFSNYAALREYFSGPLVLASLFPDQEILICFLRHKITNHSHLKLYTCLDITED